MAFFTITLASSNTETPPVTGETYNVLMADPDFENEGETTEYLGGYVETSRVERMVIMVRFLQFAVRENDTRTGQTSSDYAKLRKLLRKKHVWILGCTTQRWQDAGFLAEYNITFPFKVEPSEHSKSEPSGGLMEYSVKFLRQELL
jgi:hypothetical protein